MATTSRVLVALLLVFLTVHLVESRPELGGLETGGARSVLATIDCKSACTARCKLSSRPNLCNRACGTCCYRCNCVPPGTAGNTEVCPCYAQMTTRGGIPKCP